MTDTENFMTEVRKKWGILSKQLGMHISIIREQNHPTLGALQHGHCICGWRSQAWNEKTERDGLCAEILDHRLNHVLKRVMETEHAGAH